MSSVFDFYFLSILGEENPGREKSGGIGWQGAWDQLWQNRSRRNNPSSTTMHSILTGP